MCQYIPPKVVLWVSVVSKCFIIRPSLFTCTVEFRFFEPPREMEIGSKNREFEKSKVASNQTCFTVEWFITGGGKQLPIHSLKWNPNDVLTTCKAIYEVLVSGYTFYACADVACSNGTRTLKGRKLWRPKAADSVLSIRLGNWWIDRILRFYHVFVHFASYKDKSVLSEFFSRKVEQ